MAVNRAPVSADSSPQNSIRPPGRSRTCSTSAGSATGSSHSSAASCSIRSRIRSAGRRTACGSTDRAASTRIASDESGSFSGVIARVNYRR